MSEELVTFQFSAAEVAFLNVHGGGSERAEALLHDASQEGKAAELKLSHEETRRLMSFLMGGCHHAETSVLRQVCIQLVMKAMQQFEAGTGVAFEFDED
jgi:hypothetical protein